MKTKFKNLLALIFLVGGGVNLSAQTLYWDPATVPTNNGTGKGSGDWNTGGDVWAPSLFSTTNTAWVNGSDAHFQTSSGSGGTSDLTGGGTILVGTVTVGNSAFKIASAGFVNDGGELSATGIALTGGALTLEQVASATEDVIFKVGTGGITGPSSLTLNRDSSTAGYNLLVNSGGDVSAPTVISANTAGLVGFVATDNFSLTASVTNNSTPGTTLLAAKSGKTLTVGGTAVIGGTNALAVQIGGLGNTGTVAFSSSAGTTAKEIDVAGGTLLVSTALDSTVIKVESGATLALGADNVLSNSLALTLNGGVFAASGFSDTLGSLTLTANSAIDFGTGGFGSITFGTIDVGSWTPGTTLSIWNWSQNSDHLFATTVGGFVPDTGIFNGLGTGLRTPQITFYTDSGVTPFSAVYNQGGWSPTASTASSPFAGTNFQANEIVPVPEPTAVLSMGMLLLAIGWKERRLFARSRGTSVSPKMALA